MASQPYRAPEAQERFNTVVAVDRAAREAKRFWLSDEAFRASVSRSVVEERPFSRVLWVLENRQAPGNVRRVVRVDPADALLGRKGLDDPESFDRLTATLPGELTEDHDVSPESVPDTLQASFDPVYERPKAARLQRVTGAVVRVEYEVAQGQGTLDVDAYDGSVLGTSVVKPLEQRRFIVAAAAGATLLLGLVVVLSYAARHAWFATRPTVLVLALLALVLAAGSGLLAAELTLSKAARRTRQVSLAATVVAATLVASWLSFALGRPSAERAQRALDGRRDAEAALEAQALLSLDPEDQEAMGILDEIHLRRLERTRDIKQKSRVLGEDWYSPTIRAEAEERFRVASRAVASAAFERGARAELVELSSATSPLDEVGRDYAASLGRLLDAKADVEADAFDRAIPALAERMPKDAHAHLATVRALAVRRIRQKLPPLLKQRADAESVEQRRNAWREALALSKHLRTLTGEDPDPSVEELSEGDAASAWSVQGADAQREHVEQMKLARRARLEALADERIRKIFGKR